MFANNKITSVCLFVLAFFLGGTAFGQSTERVSVDSSGVEGNSYSKDCSISADGRFVAFVSPSDNLVAGDTNGWQDIFVHDRHTGVTERVSVDSNGVEADRFSFDPSLSADGRFVCFRSAARNLVSGATNNMDDIFVHDRLTGATERVSVDSSGAQANNGSTQAAISANGRYVAIESYASNLVAGDTNGTFDIFVHDRQTGAITRVSVDSSGVEGNGSSNIASISADGRFVAFESVAASLVANDTNYFSDVFVHDRLTGVTERVSLDSTGAEGNGGSQKAAISADGRCVAFDTWASNFTPGDNNYQQDIFVHDRLTGVTEHCSVTTGGVHGDRGSRVPQISADGRIVTFESFADNLVINDTNGFLDIFVRDRELGTTERASVDSGGGESDWESLYPSISANGRHVTFESTASNLVPGDTNGYGDIFVRDRGNGADFNTIILTGPFLSSVGDTLELSWYAAPPNSPCWLVYSPNRNGFVYAGHRFDVGLPVTILTSGINSPEGTGSFTTAPVPSGAAGGTYYLEVGSTTGTWFDSIVQPVTIN